MNVFGVGGPEFVLILLIMLIVAGPKRMLQWAYVLGTYTAKLRRLWAETMRVLQQELKASGVDVELPETPPTRQAIQRATSKALKPVVAPLEDALHELETDMKAPASDDNKTPAASTGGAFGTWSAQDDDPSKPSYGAWSNNKSPEE